MQTTTQGSSISIYTDNFTPEKAIKEVVRLRTAFPNVPVSFFDALLERVKENNFTDKRLKDAIDHLIDNFTYPVPTIANIISFDKRVKLYSYDEIIVLVNQFSASVWDNYKVIKKINNTRYFAALKDIEMYNLEVLK